MNKEEIINRLVDKDSKKAYEFAKIIGIEFGRTNKYLDLIPDLVNMLQHENSYIRTRSFVLICNQSRWLCDNQMKDIYKQMKVLLNDPKPTVVRQCLNALQEVVLYRPKLRNEIKRTISEIDLSIYKDSMIPLIRKDIDTLMKRIKDSNIKKK